MTQIFTELKQEFYYVIYANFNEDELAAIDLVNFMDFEETPEWLDIQILTEPEQVSASKGHLLESPLKDNLINETNGDVVTKAINATHAIAISGSVLNPANGLDNYIEVIIMLEIILASYNDCVAVFDLKTETLLERNEWLKQVVSNLSNDIFEIRDHVLTIRSHQEDQSLWLRTSGMIKFGKPDLSLHAIEESDEEDSLELINDLAAEIIYNNVLPRNNSELTLDGVPQGLTALHQGSYYDQDFAENVHIELEDVLIEEAI